MYIIPVNQDEPVRMLSECSFSELQKLVGGYVEVVPSFINSEEVIVCNEDGISLGLPVNSRATATQLRMFRGNIVVCSAREFERMAS